ncbi:MAG: sigma-70 family RNA polymerase sigma factor [Myxococcota bacterium]
MKRAQHGDRNAFSQIVLTLQEPLYGAVFRLVRHSQDARDIVQRALIKAWTRLPDLQNTASFRSWLFSIALNLARNHLRDRGSKRFESVEDTPLAVEPRAYRDLNAHQQRLKLRGALAELPERQREVVTLRIDTEMSFRDIGEAVGCSEGSARVNFHHGMKRLRAIVTSSPETEVNP